MATQSKIAPAKPILILLYGMPGSGKTYFARQLCENLQAAHVQGDRIRQELFEKPRGDKQETQVVTQLMDYMTGEFLSAGISVVYDFNAGRAAMRHAMRELARRAHAQPVLVWLQIDAESAFARNMRRDRRKADDKYAVPLDRTSFEQVAGSMQNPTPAEDFVVISGKHTFKTQFNALVKRLKDIGVLHIDDAANKVVKPGMVNLVPNPAAGRVNMARRNIIIR